METRTDLKIKRRDGDIGLGDVGFQIFFRDVIGEDFAAFVSGEDGGEDGFGELVSESAACEKGLEEGAVGVVVVIVHSTIQKRGCEDAGQGVEKMQGRARIK